MLKGQELARELGFNFMETSAKTNLNVELAFSTIGIYDNFNFTFILFWFLFCKY